MSGILDKKLVNRELRKNPFCLNISKKCKISRTKQAIAVYRKLESTMPIFSWHFSFILKFKQKWQRRSILLIIKSHGYHTLWFFSVEMCKNSQDSQEIWNTSSKEFRKGTTASIMPEMLQNGRTCRNSLNKI